jgi:hypothetical protein
VERPRREAALKKRSYYDDDQELPEEEEVYPGPAADAPRGDVDTSAARPLATHKLHKNVHKPSGAAASSKTAPSSRSGRVFNSSAASAPHNMASNSHSTLERDMSQWRGHQENLEQHHASPPEVHYHSMCDTGSNEHANNALLNCMSAHANYGSDYGAMMPSNLSHLYGGAMEEGALDEMHLDGPEQEARWLQKTFDDMYNSAGKGGEQSHASVLHHDDHRAGHSDDKSESTPRASPGIFKMEHDGTSDSQCSRNVNGHGQTNAALHEVPAGEDKSRTSPAIFKMDHNGMSDLQCSSSWQQGCSESGGGISWEHTQFSSTHDSDFGGCFSQNVCLQSRSAQQEGPQKCIVMYHYV